MVCVDDFSKFVLLDVLPTRQAADLRSWILKNVLGPYGRPLQIRSDRGNEFAGAFASLLQENNIRHIHIRAHAPWTNGRAERMVRTVKEAIRKLLHEYQGADWTLLVPYLQNAINSCVAKATGLTPSEVFLGEAGRPLVEQFAGVVGGKLAQADPETIKKFGKWVQAKVIAMKDAAKKREDRYLQQEEVHYNAGLARDGIKTSKHQVFTPGQLVMVKIPAVGAFGQKAKGPMVTLTQKGDSVKVKNLLTGRIAWENKSNCLGLRTIMNV